MNPTPSADLHSGYDRTTRSAAVTAALLFLTATLTFMVGDALLGNYFAEPVADTSTLTVGAALQGVCALAGVGIGLALYGVIGRHSRRLARGYLAFRSLEGAAILAIAAYTMSTQSMVAHYEILIYGFTGVAGLILSSVFLRTRLVPAWLAWLGVVGYVAILLAIPTTLLDIATLDSGAGVWLYLPGGLFELLLPLLLLARGFRRTDATPKPVGAAAGPTAVDAPA